MLLFKFFVPLGFLLFFVVLKTEFQCVFDFIYLFIVHQLMAVHLYFASAKASLV